MQRVTGSEESEKYYLGGDAVHYLDTLATRIDTPISSREGVFLGVDLGTSHVSIVAVNSDGRPLAGAFELSQYVRDGLLVDFRGAVECLRGLVTRIAPSQDGDFEAVMGGYPPNVPDADSAYVRHVIESVGLPYQGMEQEPVAANAVLRVRDGALIDVGGGTTGVAVIRDGRVIETLDEPTGGIHLTLSLAGALGVSIERAEVIKRDPTMADDVIEIVRPVVVKIASIIKHAIEPSRATAVYLFGGSTMLRGFDSIVERVIGVPVVSFELASLVTPLGIAMACVRKASYGR